MQAMHAHGARPERLVAKIFGGSRVLEIGASGRDVAQRNVQFARQILETEGIGVVAEDVADATRGDPIPHRQRARVRARDSARPARRLPCRGATPEPPWVSGSAPRRHDSPFGAAARTAAARRRRVARGGWRCFERRLCVGEDPHAPSRCCDARRRDAGDRRLRVAQPDHEGPPPAGRHGVHRHTARGRGDGEGSEARRGRLRRQATRRPGGEHGGLRRRADRQGEGRRGCEAALHPPAQERRRGPGAAGPRRTPGDRGHRSVDGGPLALRTLLEGLPEDAPAW